VGALGTFAPQEAAMFLQNYMQREEVEAIVVGAPVNLNGTPADAAQGASQFARQLRKMFPHTKIERYDERFTSKMAMQAMVAGGATRKQRRNKMLIDQISACVILQSYLDYLKCKSDRNE
jgi:putative Holliday junction resolvase